MCTRGRNLGDHLRILPTTVALVLPLYFFLSSKKCKFTVVLQHFENHQCGVKIVCLDLRYIYSYRFPGSSAGKESACNVGDLGSILGLGRSPGGGHGNTLQYSCLENPHGERSPVGYSPWGHRVRHDWATKHSTQIVLIMNSTKYNI